jgi:hypothetical protein
MFSKLLQLDTDVVTPARAAAAFQAEVSRLVREQGLSLSDAWQQVKSSEPELYARISAKPAAPAPSTLANSFQNPPVPLAQKSLLLPAFHLDPNTPDNVFSVAYQANGNRAINVDSKKVFLALLANTMKTQGVNVGAARRMLCEEQPLLARAADQTPY